MKKPTIILSVISFLLLLIVIILGIFLLKSTSDTAKLQESLNIIEAEDQNTDVSDLPLDTENTDVDTEEPNNPEDTTVTYSDEKEGLSFEFPATWDIDTDLETSDDTEGAYTRLNFHTLSFRKGSSTLQFKSVYVPTGAYAAPFDESKFEIVDLGEVLRIKEKGQSEWRYVTKVECNENIGFAEYCGTSVLAIPGGRLTAGVLTSKSEVDIKEADAIVVDATK